MNGKPKMIRENRSRTRLTLRSKINSKIVLQTKNGPIIITLTKTTGGGGDISFEAPRDVQITREELLDLQSRKDILQAALT